MDERTEEAGLSGLLTISVGGRPLELPVLTIEQSETWQRSLATTISSIEVPEKVEDGATLFGNMLVAGSAAMLKAVLAYDVTKVLGDELAKRMTQRELAAAIRAMVDAEFPLDPDIGRSVVEAFGQQAQMAQKGLQVVRDTLESFRPASSTNGHSPSGDLTPELSGAGSPRNNSSSSGVTVRAGRRAK